MNRGIIAGVVMAGTMTMVLQSQALEIGDSILDTDVKMKNVDEAMVSIADIQGEKGTLVVFTCNHCPFVKGWQDTMVELGNTYKTKGIGVIFINSNDPDKAGDTFEAMQGLAREKKYSFPYTVDASSDIARHFGASKTPDVFLFDAEGKLVYKGAVGEGGQKPKEGGEAYLKNAMDALLSGKAIERATTKAVGCSIKFR